MPGPDAVQQGVVAFATILGSIALLAGAATLCWLLLFHLALKKLPPVQEALGLRKREKPTLAEKRHEIAALKVWAGAGKGRREAKPTAAALCGRSSGCYVWLPGGAGAACS
ncbi:hypothetical protein ABPG75_012199 [Micractinium tetrahymenae]